MTRKVSLEVSELNSGLVLCRFRPFTEIGGISENTNTPDSCRWQRTTPNRVLRPANLISVDRTPTLLMTASSTKMVPWRTSCRKLYPRRHRCLTDKGARTPNPVHPHIQCSHAQTVQGPPRRPLAVVSNRQQDHTSWPSCHEALREVAGGR